MSRYILIRRLRGPAFLLLVGVIALLAQANILGWGQSWPLFLILAGVLLLAERAALASEGGYPPAPNPGAPYAGPRYTSSEYPTTGGGSPYQQPASTAIVPAPPQDLEKDPFGGRS